MLVVLNKLAKLGTSSAAWSGLPKDLVAKDKLPGNGFAPAKRQVLA